jgi:tight adherence protein B
MLAVFISLGIFLIFGAVISAIILSNEDRKRKRVMRVVAGTTALDSNKNNASDQDQRRSELAKKLKEADGPGSKKKGGGLNERIMQAGLNITTKQFWIASIISGIGLTFLAKILGMSPFVIVMASIIGFLGLPRFFLNIKAKKRQKLFMEDFPDALESMMRLLKAGMPVSEAIKMVGREFTGPMGEVMERVYDQQKIGVPLPEAVLDAAKRMPLTEMQMFATAIAIQTQTGSSLSEVLQNLAGVIRSRFKLKRKVQALSSEAKASAMIIGALPVVVATGLYFVNREYIEVLFTDPTGKFLLGSAVGWMMIGVLVMRQMINFKV